jgi:hypothetical protein
VQKKIQRVKTEFKSTVGTSAVRAREREGGREREREGGREVPALGSPSDVELFFNSCVVNNKLSPAVKKHTSPCE